MPVDFVNPHSESGDNYNAWVKGVTRVLTVHAPALLALITGKLDRPADSDEEGSKKWAELHAASILVVLSMMSAMRQI